MIVREATLADLNACLSLAHNYATEHVWQMKTSKTSTEVGVAFQVVRLPRRMKAAYPRHLDQLMDDWQRGEGFLVAEVDGLVRGYVDALALPWQNKAWVPNLAVDRAYRRRGIGTTLLLYAGRWAQSQGLRSLQVEAATKNYPALTMYEKMGFQLCGYNDSYYANQDIALFFVQMLK